MIPAHMKRCSRCGEIKPRDEFGVHRKNGRIYSQARCRPCDSAYQNEYQKRLRREKPHTARAIDSRKREQRNADPEKAALNRDYQREWKRQRYSIAPDRYRVGGSGSRDMVEAAPILEAFEASGLTVAEVAARVGVDQSALRRGLHGERLGSERAVRILEALGLAPVEVGL